MSDATTDVCSVRQAARRLGVTERLVRRWLRRGLLPARRRPGGEARIPTAAIDAFMDQHPDGDEPILNHWDEHACFGCGRLNPYGIALRFVAEGEGVRAAYVPGRTREGWSGIVHGGIVATLLDEALGWALYRHRIWAMTARLTIIYRRPVLVGQPLTVHGRVVQDRGRLIETAGEARDIAGAVLAEAAGSFVRVNAETRARLENYYGLGGAPASAG